MARGGVLASIFLLLLCGVAVLAVIGIVVFLVVRNRSQGQPGGVHPAPPPEYPPPYSAPPPTYPAPAAPPPAYPGPPPAPAAPPPAYRTPPPAPGSAPGGIVEPAAPPPSDPPPPFAEPRDADESWSDVESERGFEDVMDAPVMEAPVFGSRPIAEPAAGTQGERLSFTAAHPSQVVADAWQTLLVVLHTPSAADQVEALLARRTREFDGIPTRISTEASAPVQRGTTVTLVPTVAGVEFNPARVDVTWHEDVQESSFRMRTSAAGGTGLYGAVEVFIGPLLIAVVPIGLRVAAAGTTLAAQADVTQQASVLDRIFVSYSRHDADVVRACTAIYRALGVQVLMDTQDLRAGQDWRESLHRLIGQADLFQLYWSSAAAASSEVEHEWRYARGLAAKGGGFIRPLYWESPMPQPPAELSTIHFSRVDLEQIRHHSGA